MNEAKAEIQSTAALISGLQLAIAHLCTLLEAKGVATKSEIATSFEQTAAHLPTGLKNQKHYELVLSQIAGMIRASDSREFAAEMNKLH